MKNVPPEVQDVVREFLAEGMEVEQIAFMARVSEGLVRWIAAEDGAAPAVNTTDC